MRKILIDIEKIRYPHNGIGQYNLALGNALAKKQFDTFRPYLLIPKNQEGVFGGNVSYYPDQKYLRTMPFLQKKFNLWHSSYQSPRHLPFYRSTPFVLSIMDLNFLHEESQEVAKKEQIKLQKLVDRADYITVISKFVKNEVLKNLKVKKNIPIEVVYLSHSLELDCHSLAPRSLVDCHYPFFFTIGAITPKKNFHVLLQLLTKYPDHHLVIAGFSDTPYAKEIIEKACLQKVENRLHLLGTVNDFEKKWLYENCFCFFFPSLLEGFGIPVLEAMSLGRPVMISNKCSLPEIANGHAGLFENFNLDHMYEQLQNYLSNFNIEKRKSMIQHVQTFSWDNMLSNYISIYNKLI